MAKKIKNIAPQSVNDHIRQLVQWMAQGVYEKEQIIAMALLCAVAGENMFLLGPPGTAKSMVASRLKMVFPGGRSFDYLMSRFSTPDEIFGPISISRLKNDDRYERLTAGYLPEADVVFLDEIWKAGPSIQNTLLTVINEHIFHNGANSVHTPMKVLIAASNELPAKDEGLEALWDRFLVRMVSNCIESDSAFFKMMQSAGGEMSPLPEALWLTDRLYEQWQEESKAVGMRGEVVDAIKALRKIMAQHEKTDGNGLRFYISDRRWRKAYRLMQTSAYLNGRSEIDLTDYLLLVHSFWNDVEAIAVVLEAFTASIAAGIVRDLEKIDKQLRALASPQKGQPSVESFMEHDHIYYLVENYPGGDTYFSKWDYKSLTSTPRDGVRYYDDKRRHYVIHLLVPGQPFDAKAQGSRGDITRLKVQPCQNGAIINGTPYAFRRRPGAVDSAAPLPAYDRALALKETFAEAVNGWRQSVERHWEKCDNIFLAASDLALIDKMIKDVDNSIKTLDVKINNALMLLK